MAEGKSITAKELLEIIKDPETSSGYVNEDVTKMMGQKISSDGDDGFHMELPYAEITEYVKMTGEEILSKFSEEDVKLLQWEHVGSTSINGMPGTSHPDALLMCESFPPSENVLEVLIESSFHMWRIGSPWDENELWFVKLIPEDGFLKGSLFTIHLVDKASSSGKVLLEIRDTCRNEQWAFDEYKATKVAASKADNFLEYKKLKSESKLLQIVREKYSIEASVPEMKEEK